MKNNEKGKNFVSKCKIPETTILATSWDTTFYRMTPYKEIYQEERRTKDIVVKQRNRLYRNDSRNITDSNEKQYWVETSMN